MSNTLIVFCGRGGGAGVLLPYHEVHTAHSDKLPTACRRALGQNPVAYWFRCDREGSCDDWHRDRDKSLTMTKNVASGECSFKAPEEYIQHLCVAETNPHVRCNELRQEITSMLSNQTFIFCAHSGEE